MRAVILEAAGDMHVGTLETPEPGSGEILVSVDAAGICAGDMYCFLGKNPYIIYPQVIGHEISGKVAALGPGVLAPAIGTPVVVEPFIGCGTCYPCRIGKRNCCVNLKIIGAHLPGGYADYVVAPATNVHPVPPGLSPVWASFAEPVAIGVQACRRGSIGKEELILVLGCGPIGLAVIEVAKARGARIMAADVDPERLALAGGLGVLTIPSDDNMRYAVLDQTGGEGVPVVVEATGATQAMQQAAELVAAGGRIVILGLVKKGVEVGLPGLDFTRKEMTILGSRASVRCFPEALGLLASGALTYPSLATEFLLWDAPSVFAELAEHPRSVHKGVLVHP